MKCIPLLPCVYGEKLGYAGAFLFFLFLIQNIACGYSLRVPTIYVLSKRIKNVNIFPSEFSMFASEKKSLLIAWESFRNGKFRRLAVLIRQIDNAKLTWLKAAGN